VAYKIVFLFILSVLVISSNRTVLAQDTFGPVCDGITVTCPPTPIPTTPPAEPTPITELPRAGITDSINILIFVAAGLIITGIFAHAKLHTHKRSR